VAQGESGIDNKVLEFADNNGFTFDPNADVTLDDVYTLGGEMIQWSGNEAFNDPNHVNTAWNILDLASREIGGVCDDTNANYAMCVKTQMTNNLWEGAGNDPAALWQYLTDTDTYTISEDVKGLLAENFGNGVANVGQLLLGISQQEWADALDFMDTLENNAYGTILENSALGTHVTESRADGTAAEMMGIDGFGNNWADFEELTVGEVEIQIDSLVVAAEADYVALKDTYLESGENPGLRTFGQAIADSASASSNGFACSGQTVTDFEVHNTALGVEAIASCTHTFNDNKRRKLLAGKSAVELVDSSLAMLEAVSIPPTLVGGYFFSEILGTYEAFLASVPGSYCMLAKDLEEIESGTTVAYGFYVYYLHGWGESAGLLAEIAPFLETLSMQPEMIIPSLVVVAPDDNSSPFGGRTWYRNSDFTGYHVDMIVFELPVFIGASTGLTAVTSGLFGCSMGGVGAYSILMTYPWAYTGAVPFNAPTESNPCVAYGTCHLECLVDAFMCELVWTSVGVAFNPFVLVGVGAVMQSAGYYMPFGFGIAHAASISEHASCLTSEHSVIAKGSGRFMNNMPDREGPKGDSNMNSPPRYAFGYDSSDLDGITGEAYFWLDPNWFIVVTQGFSPTHNVHTDAENCNAAFTEGRLIDLVKAMPLWRLDDYGTVFSNNGATFLFVSTDSNDDFDIDAMAHTFVTKANQLSGSSASIYEDIYGMGGHTMSMRDFKTAWQFFSDIYGTLATANSELLTGVEMLGDAVPVCAYYLRQDEVTLVQQSSGAKIDYRNPYTEYVVDPVVDYTNPSYHADPNNYVYPSTECSGSDRPAFSWGDWDCGGCASSGGQLSEDQIAKFNGMIQEREVGDCYAAAVFAAVANF